MRGEIEKLEPEKLLQRDEIRALKAGSFSYQDELKSLNGRVHGLEEQTLQEAEYRKGGSAAVPRTTSTAHGKRLR